MSSWTLSDVLGYISICCWLGAQFPQLVENARRKSVEGLSLPFLANWFLGDFTNLLGCILTHQLPFQTYLATYFVFVDFSILSQYYYYRKPPPPATPYLRARSMSLGGRISEDRGHYRSLSIAAANVAATAAIAATHQEVQSPHVLHRLSRRSVDETSEPIRSLVEMTDDEEYDEEVLARLADSIQSEGGRSRKHVSWSTISRGRRSGSLGPITQQALPSRRSARPSLQMTDSREVESDLRGRPQQRGVDTGDGWRGSESSVTPTSARPSRSRASKRSASLVFLGFWALFGVGTLVGSRRHLPLSSSVSVGRVLTPVDDQTPRALDPSKVIQYDEPEDFSWAAIPADAGSTDHQDLPPPEESPPLERIIGRMSAWACTTLYLTSRLPQIWKNFVRKSVEGLSMYLFIFAFLGNTFYVSSILTSPKLDVSGPEASAYIQESLPYIMGSAGTLMFDVTIVSQSFLYRKSADKEKAGRGRSRVSQGASAEEEGLLSAGATGANEGVSQHRRRTVGDTDDNRAIVLDFLCHSSYTNTARAFSRECTVRNVNVDPDGDEIMSGDGKDELASGEDTELILSEDTLKQIELRKEIRQKILSGRVDEAVDLLHAHFPTVLTRSSLDTEMDDDSYFFPNQKRRKVDPHAPSIPSPSTIQFLRSTTVDPLHLNLNLRILAFTEACRTIPLPYPPPSVVPSLAGSPSLPDVRTGIDDGGGPVPTPGLIPDESTDPIAHQQHLINLITRIQKLYVLANTLPKESDRKTYAEELDQVGGLLAYKIPEKSPMTRYLSQGRREAVADQINAAVLYQTQHSAVSKLELQVRYTATLWGWMHDMRKWPHGVHPPGNASAVTTPTMEKLAIQGDHAVEQKEVGSRPGARRNRH
ncbi:hypothetical protein BDM02DRAFT_3156563 [Thelephora ganbajun]|uniref:Uncharacterized protein n=1 Tax=Thelephora ganbajun TaxID=370292 RepID=A0ACB6ZA80_THEGA|nr:hypothetical protein BDM02DRAFT_3156563 [Thelephora ganbajun]